MQFPKRLLALVALACSLPCAAQSLPWIGLTNYGSQLFENEGWVPFGLPPYAAGTNDQSGSALASGDFNNDGRDDLVIGVPRRDCNGNADCGALHIRFGGSPGPLATVLTLDPSYPGTPWDRPLHYGAALAVGDFDNDSHDDLLVGAPGRSSGGVFVHYGRPGGSGSIQWVAQHLLYQGRDGFPGAPVGNEEFGSTMAVGDFDGDRHDDVAIGAHYEEAYRGGVYVAHGHTQGLVPANAFWMRLGYLGLPDSPTSGDHFGGALAAGDFNNDTFDDLAIGVPGYDALGAVLVVYGSPNSLIFPNHRFFSQYDLNGTVNVGGRFGQRLAVGDFDGDGFDDLAIGDPGFDGDASTTNMGMVALVFGGSDGVNPSRHQFVWQTNLAGPFQSEAEDEFGRAFVVADFDGDGRDDLVVGTPGEGDGDFTGTHHGAATVLMGSQNRNLTIARLLRPGGPAEFLIPDQPAQDSRYGWALATGDFDGNGRSDLAIGAPWQNRADGPVDTGTVAVLYAQSGPLPAPIFVDGFEED